MNIKVYEPQLIVYYQDLNWVNFVFTPVKNKEKLFEALNKDKFVKIEDTIIKVSKILKVEPYQPKNDLESWILLQPPHIRKILYKRDKQKQETLWRWIESIKEAIRYLKNKWITDFIT